MHPSDVLELRLEELEASASEDELLAETAAAKTTSVAAFADEIGTWQR